MNVKAFKGKENFPNAPCNMIDHCTVGAIKHEHVDRRCRDLTTVTEGKLQFRTGQK